MIFTIKGCLSNERINTIKQILEKTKFILNADNIKLTQDRENILFNLLVSPFESELLKKAYHIDEDTPLIL